MQRRPSMLFVIVIVALTPLLMTKPASALPPGVIVEGITSKTLAELPSEIPGIKKIKLKELRVEPGAKRENYVVKSTSFCTVVQGELTVVTDNGTVVHGPGSTWMMRKGTKQSIYNKGSELHIQQVWSLVH